MKVKPLVRPPRSSQDPSSTTDLTRKSYVDGQVANVADDLTTLENAVVRTSGNQTVSGLKTFNTVPRVTADPTNANDLVRKSFLPGTKRTPPPNRFPKLG